jgi:multidrug resistance efflux pump
MAESRGFHIGRRFWALIGLAALLGYVAWIGAPYLRSVVVRDAAVTTWIDDVESPIRGYVDKNPLHAGARVGADGRIATVENPIEDATPVARAEAELERAKQRVRGFQDLLPSLDGDAAARARAEMVLADAKVVAATAETILVSTKRAYEQAHRQPIWAPPGAMVWSLIASPGAAVQPGTPVASWINCSVMLVDVPVSDVELALLRKGAPARVVIEGERRVRDGTVFITRGAAPTIGAADLAALAKGRQPGTGQVLVKLEPSPADVEACPIGAAAFVDFPEIGIVDMLRARLRF